MQVIPYNQDKAGKKEQVAKMFDNISHRYDFLNHFLSLGIDKVWRRKAIETLNTLKPKTILDVATGTGDFAIQSLSLNPDKIVGIDISEGMLGNGRIKLNEKELNDKVELLSGDSENIPFSENTFESVTGAFGVWKFDKLELGLFF
jgi:demethylmenaquinone methyltransferase/2-methoxy-6-polyprenyl-1,4-benzoquinol methylase